jgi:hypothetical protein
MTLFKICAATIGMLATTTVVAGAAEPARNLSQMAVAAGDTIYVRPVDGAEIQGRFVRASTQTLVITTLDGSERELEAASVLTVWKRGDRLRNGAIIGGIVGLLGGIFGHSACTDCSSEIAIGVGLGVPLWAAIGAFIDAQHVGRTMIYMAP